MCYSSSIRFYLIVQSGSCQTKMVVGHFYYFLEYVFPTKSGGIRILKTPRFLSAIFDPVTEDPDYAPLPEDRPGGFDWGNGAEGQQGPDNN